MLDPNHNNPRRKHRQQNLGHCWCGPCPTGSVCCGCNGQIHTDYRNSVEKKGWHGHSLSEREGKRARENPRESPTPAWTGFYCFSGHITLKMVLIYYAQVHCRWLPFTDSKGKNVANYFKEKDVTAGGGNCHTPYMGGLTQTLGS